MQRRAALQPRTQQHAALLLHIKLAAQLRIQLQRRLILVAQLQLLTTPQGQQRQHILQAAVRRRHLPQPSVRHRHLQRRLLQLRVP